MKKTRFNILAVCFIISALYITTAFNAPTNGDTIPDSVIQSDLLKKAMDYVGVDNPDKAIDVWSEGLKQRNGAMQYSVMTKVLKDIYAKDLENGHANWVTGVSSPWVAGYKVLNKEKVKSAYIYTITYNTATSAGPFDPFNVRLTVVKDGDFWRISEVNGDEASTAYTGFVD